MILLAFLGFTNFSRALPLNDKLLHFFCFGIATAVFYFIIDVEEQARRIWFWRYSSLIFTGITCIFCGGILSEFVQAALPYKEFDAYDIVANICGSSLGLTISFHLEKYYRRRREIARLYRPLDGEYSSDEEDVFSVGSALLPTHTRRPKTPKTSKKNVRFADAWNDDDEERQPVFDVGPESDDDDDRSAGPSQGPSKPPPPPPSTRKADASNQKKPLDDDS
ncbi:hypothetical protein BKA70DRAFT_1369641 [Coprinopsis sp. MPI-PUGE-AT-0042]|nr:hypothetical protein BKA70DRAFT_1369641 [Coprinopsis sp. MPI-PUGE-AT-0042]